MAAWWINPSVRMEIGSAACLCLTWSIKATVQRGNTSSVQTSMDRVEFHYVLPSEQQELSQTMQETLQHQLRKHLGTGLHVDFVKGQFLVTPSGKHRIFVNAIPQSRKDNVELTRRSEVAQ